MKGLKIAINIILIVQLILLVAMAILWPTVFLQNAVNNIPTDSPDGATFGEQLGKAFGAGFLAIFVVLFFLALCVLFAVAAIIDLIFIIVYNVKKYPNMFICIFTLIIISLPAGILMIIQRSKYLNALKETAE